MWHLPLFLVNIFLVSTVFCANLRDRRFLMPVTTYVTKIETKAVAASCVKVEATATACEGDKSSIVIGFRPQTAIGRCATALPFHGWYELDPTGTSTAQNSTEKPIAENSTAQKNATEGSGKAWAAYFDFRPTFTKTLTFMTAVTDSRVVVTYDVKGCIPQGFPKDLPRCEVTPLVTPTQTAVGSIQSTLIPEISNEIQPSNESPREPGRRVQLPTKPLPY